MDNFLYFLKEKRASLLIGTGAVTTFVWFLFMLYFRLFELKPFGAESHWSMALTLVVFVSLAFVLLWVVYFFGSDDSPLQGTDYDFAYQLSQWLYVTFKNCMVIFLIATLIIGGPRIKYYQMRIVEGSGFDNLSYYQSRTILNIFRNGSQIVGTTSDHNEQVDGVGFFPIFSGGSTSSTDSDSSSSSKSKDSDGGNGFAELALMLLAVIAILASLVFYLSLVALSLMFTNFWLVAVPCIGIGMITLGFIDIKDGSEI